MSDLGRMREMVFSVAVAGISRGLILRDRATRRVRRDEGVDGAGMERLSIVSGVKVLDARLVQPERQPATGAVLICHGIGETVEHWARVQRMLARHGVASLVFNYSGLGRSTGWFGVAASERDAVAAFAELRRRVRVPDIAVLGYSLGSGIATAVAQEVGAHRLVLCAVYPSMREAACRAGLPRAMRGIVPEVWETEKALRGLGIPVLIVQGEEDRLFPPGLAREVAAACGMGCELVIVPGLSHNGPIYRPEGSYWEPVARWLSAED